MRPEMEPDCLRADWCALLRPFGVAESAARATFADLAAHYTAADRFYHNLQHIRQVLQTITGLSAGADHLAAVQLAAWFHDVIHDSRAGDNEEQSAAHAGTTLHALQIPPPTITAVRDLILKTKHHQTSDDDRDGQILLDADLAILGAGPEDYGSYARAIRQEYAWVPDDPYRAGRRQVLEKFLRRERIYFTEPMYFQREARARQNLRQEIASLT